MTIGLTPAFAFHSPFGVNLLMNERVGTVPKRLPTAADRALERSARPAAV
jgi:hypothetical protein